MEEMDVELSDGRLTFEYDLDHVMLSQLLATIKGLTRLQAVEAINLFGCKVVTIW